MEGVIEPGKAKAKKKLKFSLNGIVVLAFVSSFVLFLLFFLLCFSPPNASDQIIDFTIGLGVPPITFTNSGWPSVDGATMSVLAGNPKVLFVYYFNLLFLVHGIFDTLTLS